MHNPYMLTLMFGTPKKTECATLKQTQAKFLAATKTVLRRKLI